MAGEEHAWEELATLDPADVCARAAVGYEEGTGYIVPVFGTPIVVDPAAQTFEASSPEGRFVLTKTAYFARISILFYLIKAQDMPLSGRLVQPAGLKCGQFFAQGSHELPLQPTAARFATDSAGFLAQGARFGGRPVAYGDAAVEFLPLPRVPITMILWEGDDEFPARCDLLFDAADELQVPADILWSVAMMNAIAMFKA